MNLTHWALPSDHPYRYDGSEFGGPSLWAPNQLTTAAWYDASAIDTITESGGAVSQWDDLSGNDYHLTQGVGARQPDTGTRTIGGLNAIEFDDSANQGLGISSGSFSKSQPIDIFVVAEADNTGQNVFYDTNNAGLTLNFYTNTNFTMAEGKFVNQGAADTDPHVHFHRYKGASSLWGMDGSSPATVDAGTNNLPGLVVGNIRNYFTPGWTLNGAIAELVLVHSELSEADRQKLEGYLAHKWGLEDNLPGAHPYKSAAPTV